MNNTASVLARIAAELFYRSARLKAYLDCLGPGEAGEHRILQQTLLEAIEGIEHWVREAFRKTWPVVLQPERPEHIKHVRELLRALRRFSVWFSRIHEILVYLPRLPIPAETWFTLEGVLPLAKLPPPSVITGSVFNAFEFDFIEHLEGRIPDLREILTKPSHAVLQMAVCDRDSPLAYPILAHELGHAIDLDKGFSHSVAAMYVLNENTEEFEIVKNWCAEIVADLVAADLLGPSPMLALLSMEYCLSPQMPICGHSATHPATRCRLEMVSDYLKSRLGRDFLLQEHRSYLSAWEFSVTHVLGTQDPDGFKHMYDLEDEIIKSEFYPKLREQVLSLQIGRPTLDSDHLDRCVARLLAHSPISAQGLPRQELRSEIASYRGRSFSSRREGTREFERLVEMFGERPLDEIDILLAGHHARRKVLQRRRLRNCPFRSKTGVSTLCEELRTIERLVGSSVVSSNVHKEIEKRRLSSQSGAI